MVLFLITTPITNYTKAIRKLFNLKRELSFKNESALAFNALFFNNSAKKLKPQTKSKIVHLDFFLILLSKKGSVSHSTIRDLSNLFTSKGVSVSSIRRAYNNKCKQLVSGQTLCFKTSKKTRSLVSSFKSSKSSFKKNYLLKAVLFTLNLMSLSSVYAKKFSNSRVVSNRNTLSVYYTIFKFVFDFKSSLPYIYLKLQLKILRKSRFKKN